MQSKYKQQFWKNACSHTSKNCNKNQIIASGQKINEWIFSKNSNLIFAYFPTVEVNHSKLISQNWVLRESHGIKLIILTYKNFEPQ